MTSIESVTLEVAAFTDPDGFAWAAA